MSEHESNTVSFDGHLNDEDHLNDAGPDSAIRIPPN